MHRPTAGILAIVLLTAGVGLYFWPPSEMWFHFGQGCLKCGIIVGLLWFAHPQLSKMPDWLPPMLLVSLLVGLRWPRLLPWLALAAAVMYLLDPYKKKESPGAGRKVSRDRGAERAGRRD